MSTLDRTATLAQIVVDHPECAVVLQNFRLDFCCRGNRSLAEACADTDDQAALVVALEEAIASRVENTFSPQAATTGDLIEHIISRHHVYLREAFPFIEPLATKVTRVHGEREPRLASLLAVLRDLRSLLEPHLDREERSLFPELLMRRPDRSLVDAELAAMREDHLTVGEKLATLRALSDDFSPPDWACGSYRALLSALAALETDTLRHVHLENHVLMPRFASP